MKKSGVFESSGYLIKRLQQEIRRRMDEILGQQGITPPQFATLSTIKMNNNVSNAELARISFVTPQTMVRITANLQEAGFIQKKKDPIHGRIIRIELTEEGEKLINHCQALVSGVENKIVSGFTKEEAQSFRLLLSKSLSNFQDP